MGRVILILILTFIIFNECIFAQPGFLDQTFGGDGIVIANFSNTSEDVGRALAIQPDGKIVFVGYTSFDTSRIMVCRYLPDGSLDTSFGTNGKAIVNPEGSMANAVALQADGKIIVAGAAGKFLLSRLNNDGSIDSAFGLNGSILIWPAYQMYDDEATAVVIQPAEPTPKIIVVGTSKDESDPFGTVMTILRFNINGTLDSTFNNTGILNYGSPGGWPNQKLAYAAALQPDNKLLVGGLHIDPDWPEYREVIIRLNDDGTLDSTFSDDGVLIDESLSWCRSLLVQSDGKIIAIGASNTRFAMARYNIDGSPDSSFGINGKVIGNNVGSLDEGQAGVLQANWKIIVTGWMYEDYLQEFFKTSCYNSDGTIDTTFGNGGSVITAIDYNSYALSVALQTDGKIVVGGTSENHDSDSSSMVVVRYLSEFNTGMINFISDHTANYIYPNPVIENKIVLKYELPETELITLSLLNINGDEIYLFANQQPKSQGKHSETLNLPSLTSGIYFLNLRTTSGNINIRMIKQ